MALLPISGPKVGWGGQKPPGEAITPVRTGEPKGHETPLTRLIDDIYVKGRITREDLTNLLTCLRGSPITLKEQSQIDGLLRGLSRDNIAGNADQVLCDVVGIKNPLVKEYGRAGYYHNDQNHPMRVAIRANDRVRFVGSSTARNLYEDNGPKLRDEHVGTIGIHGAGPEMVLDYLQKNWSKLDVGFQDGMTIVLLGMGINKKMDGLTPRQYAKTTLDGTLKIARFLEGKAREQGKHIRVLISGLQPQPHDPEKNQGIQLFNQMLQADKDHYQPFADLSPLVTDPGGRWKPGAHEKDGKHINPDILRGFIRNVLDKAPPVTTGSVAPSLRDPYGASPPAGMRISLLFRPSSP